MKTFITLTVLASVLIVPVSIAADNPHCVTSTDGYGITTTQCDNGTVTITNGRDKTATVCTGGSGYSLNCRELKL